MSTIKVTRVHFRSLKDVMVEQASEKLEEATGEPKKFWSTILRWRLKHFRGDVGRALACRDESGRPVFVP